MNKNLMIFKQAIKNLTSSKLRTLLTSLGIIIGIATVVIVLSVGEGFKGFIQSQVAAFGSDTITITTKVPSGRSGRDNTSAITSLKTRDIESITELVGVGGAYGAIYSQKLAARGNVRKNALIFGSDSNRFKIDTGKIANGRSYTENEDKALAQVAILGSDIAKIFFGDSDPLGKSVRVGEYNFEVIGVYEPRGSFGFSNDDEQIFVPLRTLQKKLMGIDHLLYIVAQLDDPSNSEGIKSDIARVIRRNHDIQDAAKDDFEVQTQAGTLETFDTILGATSIMLVVIASISLLVGGVGIMNILYVAITERTPEIGLKKALGARRSDILTEFMIESLCLTLIGGILGVGVGAGISLLIYLGAVTAGFAWVYVVPLNAILLGVGLAVVIGLVFGVRPAWVASKLDAIEALRSE